MTPEDMRKLREFFDSPAGRRMMGEMNRAFDVRPMSCDEPVAFWRDASTGERLEVEAACVDPLDPLRAFPAPRPPKPLARPVSPWPAIIAAILSTAAFAMLIAWYVSAALKAHS